MDRAHPPLRCAKKTLPSARTSASLLNRKAVCLDLWPSGKERKVACPGSREELGQSNLPGSNQMASPPSLPSPGLWQDPISCEQGNKTHSVKSQCLRQETDLAQGAVVQDRVKIVRIMDAVQSAQEVLRIWWLHTGPGAAFVETQLRRSSWEQPVALNTSGMSLSSLEIIL